MATLSELKTFVQRIIQDSSFDDDIIGYLNQAQMEIAGGMQSTLGNWITPPLPELLTIDSISTDTAEAAYTTWVDIRTLISTGDTLSFVFNSTSVSVTFTGIYETAQTDIDTGLISAGLTANDVVVSWADTDDLVLTCNNDVNSDTIVGSTYTDIDTTNTTDPTDTALVAAVGYVSMPSNFQRELQFVSNASGAEIDIEENFILFSETYPLLNQSGSVSSVIEKGNKFYYQGIPTSETDLTIHYYRYPTDMSLDADEPDGIPKHLQKSLLVNHACWKIFELIEDGLEGPGVNTQRYMELFYQALKVLELTIPYPTRGIDLINE